MSDGREKWSATRRRDFLRLSGATAAVVLGGLGSVYAIRTAGELTVRLGTVSGTQGLWRYTAQQRDLLFTSHGYTVSYQQFASEADLRAAFLAHQLDLIDSAVPTVALLHEAGSDARFFLPTAWVHQSYPFVVRSNSAARTLGSLAGRSVSSHPLDDPMMAYWLALAPTVLGVDLRQMRLSPSPQPDLLLLNASVDGACVPTNRWEILASDPTFRVVADLQGIWKTFSGSARPLVVGGYIADLEFLRRHAAFVRDFVVGHRIALTAYQQHRDEFLSLVARYHDGPTLTPALSQVQATALGYDDATLDGLTLSDDDVRDYARLFTLMAQHGYLKEAPNVATLFDQIAI